MFYPIIICFFELRSKIGCISEIKINAIYFVFHSICTIFVARNPNMLG